MPAMLLYVTASSKEEALRIGRTLVEERLAACANIIAPTTAIYWWEGAVQEEPEAALVLKTQARLTDAVTTRVKQLHGHSCPCVVAFPIAGGNPDFLDWIVKETS